MALDLNVSALGQASPILKETRAPAIVVLSDDLNPLLGARVIDSVRAFFARPNP